MNRQTKEDGDRKSIVVIRKIPSNNGVRLIALGVNDSLKLKYINTACMELLRTFEFVEVMLLYFVVGVSGRPLLKNFYIIDNWKSIASVDSDKQSTVHAAFCYEVNLQMETNNWALRLRSQKFYLGQ